MFRVSRRRVAFSETDASGRAHFTALLKWAEDAEHELLHALGVTVCSSDQGWPRVRVECDYRLPLSAGEEARVEIELAEIGESSLSWKFRILKKDEALAAEGRIVTVSVGPEGSLKITPDLRAKLSGPPEGSSAS